MRDWLKATGGPVGIVALGTFLVFPAKALGFALIAVGLIWYSIGHKRFREWLPITWTGFGEHHAQDFSASYIADREIRIADLFPPGESKVSGKTFERCCFSGPAVIAFLGSSIYSAGFDVGGLFTGALFWEVDEGQIVIGGVAFEHCTLRDCKFTSCGIAGTKDQLEMIQKELEDRR